MLIDWFTVIAQVLNFLILVWLLQHFLYKPILNAIDAREKRIADKLANADAKKADAQKEQDEFKRKNEEFDQQHSALLNKARDEAKAERQRLMDEARKAAADLSSKLQETLKNDKRNLNQEISRRTRQEVFAISRKVLSDLAGASLEERMVDVFVRRLRELNDTEKGQLVSEFNSPSGPILVRTTFDLPPAQRDLIEGAVKETLDKEAQIRFETAPDLISGVELTVNGQKVAWSIEDYLDIAGKGRRRASERTVQNLKPEPGLSLNPMNLSQNPSLSLRKRLKPSQSPNKEPMNMEPESLQRVFDSTFAGISKVRETFTPELSPREVGAIKAVSTGIANVSGLPGVGFEELVKFPGEVFGIAFNVDENEIGVVLLGEYWHLHAGDEVERTGRVMDVAVGDRLLGRVIDPLGRPLDGKGPVISSKRLPIERPSPPIMDRSPVTVPLQTGLKVIDTLIPIGRGQRELILGDRQTGKTTIAIDTILNQRDYNVLCVYCAIGQRASAVARVVATLREKGAMDYTVVVVTEGNDPSGLAYVAPYAATSIAEYFMEEGRDVLIVYDDLIQHARAYRELSLLLRRPPGREAYPGDIFYIHSRLLERATHLRKELGGGSLTALPIVETEAQNISAYIPTNLISITDGQIYLSPSLFELGVLPAVDVGKSVSRVGGKAQREVYRNVAGDLKLAYSQFEELETFTRFGARLDENTQKIIEHGRRIRALLKQPESAPVSVPEQIIILLALTAKLFDRVPLERMTDAEHSLREAAEDIPAEVRERFDTDAELSDKDRETILQIALKALARFQSRPEPESEQEAQNEVKPE